MALPSMPARGAGGRGGADNSHSGYGSADIQFLQPLLSTVGQLEMVRRAEDRRWTPSGCAPPALLGEKTNAQYHAGQRPAGAS